MAEEGDQPLYPQYCFHLSQTINKFCPLRSVDIERLTGQPGFEGQDVFFHLNHPVKWVRITGMVVAVDEFPPRRVYTVDDSSGVCIECVVANVPRPDPRAEAGSSKQPAVAATPRVPDEVDVGTLVDVKGGLTLFRGNKQIKVERATVIRSTEQEVACWEKVEAFRREVLDRPWKLTHREVRRCRKEAERNGPADSLRITCQVRGDGESRSTPAPGGADGHHQEAALPAHLPTVRAMNNADPCVDGISQRTAQMRSAKLYEKPSHCLAPSLRGLAAENSAAGFFEARATYRQPCTLPLEDDATFEPSMSTASE